MLCWWPMKSYLDRKFTDQATSVKVGPTGGMITHGANGNFPVKPILFHHQTGEAQNEIIRLHNR